MNNIKIRFFAAFCFALITNILIFSLLPILFTNSTVNKEIIDNAIPVNFIKSVTLTPPPEKEEKPLREEQKEPKKMIPQVKIRATPERAKEIEKIDIPDLPFQLNLKLTGGMPVSAPLTPSTGISTPILKEFYEHDEVDRKPVAIYKTEPEYPYRARKFEITGKVAVKFLVDEKGKTSQISIITSSPPEIFNDSVERAVLSWRFSPGEVKGKPVKTWLKVQIKFTLDER